MIKRPAKKKSIPFAFVVEELAPIESYTRSMFGCTAVYSDEKILCILRDKPDSHREDNGIWIATDRTHHAALEKEMPSLRPIAMFGEGTSNWRLLPVGCHGFEAEAFRFCELARQGDSRVGRVPKPRKRFKK